MTRAGLRSLAEDAISTGEGRWEPYFTTHGDPYVTEVGRSQFGVVATVSTAPDDYGRARAQYIAAADPATVLELLNAIEFAMPYIEDYEAADRLKALLG